jgi:hypothetical protein
MLAIKHLGLHLVTSHFKLVQLIFCIFKSIEYVTYATPSLVKVTSKSLAHNV